MRRTGTRLLVGLALFWCSTAAAQVAGPAGLAEQVDHGSSNLEPDAASQDHWQLVWADEFDGERINRANWTFDVDCWGGGNQERQCYTARAVNAAVRDGMLVITARRENHTGPAVPPHMRDDASNRRARATKPYTSARLSTRGSGAWRYGRIEVRAELPQGQGVWPAIWMLPETDRYGSWAASGEIDILEAVNLGTLCAECPGGRESTILGTLHHGGQWPDNAFTSAEIAFPEVLDGFHTYGIIWEAGRIRWTVDGRVYAEQQAGDWGTTGSDDPFAPFDQPFHLILNLAIGGGLPEGRGEGGVSGAGFPKMMKVDWVRVWQYCDTCDSVPSTGGMGE